METRKPSPTDLNDKQWQILPPLVPSDKTGGRPSTYEKRHIIKAILSVLRPGSAWRMMPNDLPPWGIVYHYFRTWRKDSTWERIHDTLRGDLRVLLGRPRPPSAACLDAQSVKTTDRGGAKGFDSAKHVKGSKRHILVDTLGLLLAVLVTAAGLQDRDGAKSLLGFLRHQGTRLRRMWADGADAGELEAWVQSLRGYRKVHLAIVRRAEGRKGFVVLPKRWIVERTLGWLGKYRRLSKDYEYLTETSVAMMQVVMIHSMLRRIAAKSAF
jgi:putative transposase